MVNFFRCPSSAAFIPRFRHEVNLRTSHLFYDTCICTGPPASRPPPTPPTKKIKFKKIHARDTNDNEAQWVNVGSKTVQPLDFFAVSEVDFAAGRVPSPWAEHNAPDLAAVLEMRLEADAREKVAQFGCGRLSTRSCDVRNKVTTQRLRGC